LRYHAVREGWWPLAPPISTLLATQIFAISALVQGFFLLTGNFCVPGSADEFVDFGKALLSLLQGRLELVPWVADRSVGYPVLLALSGFYQNGSLIGMTIIQALMAMIIPVLIYRTVQPVSVRGAYYVALASILSLGPFLFVKWLFHDQTYVFFSVVMLWRFSKFVHSKRWQDLIWLTLAIVATTFARPAGGLLFPLLIVAAYSIVRGPIRHYVGAIGLFVLLALANHALRAELLYAADGKSHEYTGGQIFYDVYMNSLDYGMQLSEDLGPNMKQITDKMYEAMLPSPRSSEFLRTFWDGESPSQQFRDQVITPFLTKYFYPYTAKEFRVQLYRLPNWEYYWMICRLVPDSVLLRASWEIIKAHPLFVVLFVARNTWYMLYEPGYFHTRFNPIPIFHGGLTFPVDGQEAIGGKVFGAEATILGLPARATREVGFDTLEAQPNWIKQLYRGIRAIWLDWYDTVMHGLFFLTVAAWAALLLDWATMWVRPGTLRKWSECIGANQLSAHVLYLSVFLLYNSVVTAAFSEPEYRYSDMLMLPKLLLAGLGCVALARLLREFLCSLSPALREGRKHVSAQTIDVHEGPVVAVAGAVATAICVGWAWYMIVQTW
jgi:hypothetical protein